MNNLIVGNLEISASDLPNKMSWNDIPSAIEALGGNGWRLPTEEEFATLYHLFEKGTIVFKAEKYWASSFYQNYAWYYDLSVGYSPHILLKTEKCYVRLVRSI